MSMRDNSPRIDLLLADDDQAFLDHVQDHFRRLGYHVETASNGADAWELAQRRKFDVAVLDMVMPQMTGLELLRNLKSHEGEAPEWNGGNCEVVLLTGEGTVATAVEAMKLGAADFLTKPAKLKEIEAVVQKAASAAELRKENRQLKAVLRRMESSDQMIGECQAMQELNRLIDRAGPTNHPILIQGESGTGKELVARALHRCSPRADKPLVVINCAALPELLLESELFGHEKGAFTSATSAKAGLFEVADGGTLFIDEIGELATPLQAKLLRVLEDGTMRRVGSIKERRVDVRLITATNCNMDEEVKAGRFRRDLYFRIDVMTMHLPPLRERGDDIRLLARHFAGPDWTIEPSAMEAFYRYEWPGNVRQMINILERAKILSDDKSIRLVNLPSEFHPAEGLPPELQHLQHAVNGNGTSEKLGTLESMKKEEVRKAMARERGNKVRAARALGISRRSLYRLLEKYDMTGKSKATT